MKKQQRQPKQESKRTNRETAIPTDKKLDGPNRPAE